MKQIIKQFNKIIFLFAIIVISFGMKSVKAETDRFPYSSNFFCAESGYKRGYMDYYYREKTVTKKSSDGKEWHMLRIYC